MSDIPASDPPATGPDLPVAPPIAAPSPEKVAAQKRFETRLWCTFLFLTCAAMLTIGIKLNPDSHGVGTHQQLGFPPCGLMQTTGVPCPTCGCTTAVTLLMHGHPVAAFLTQPFGFAVGALALTLLPLTLFGAVTGNWKGPSMFILGWYWRYWVYGSLAIFVLAWAFKVISVQLHMAF